MTIDLTKIDKPFGELDEVTQLALEGAMALKRKIQMRHAQGVWLERTIASNNPFSPNTIYRLAPPEPVKETLEYRQGVGIFEGFGPDFYSIGYGEFKGTTTVDLVDGKPVKIVWEADQ